MRKQDKKIYYVVEQCNRRIGFRVIIKTNIHTLYDGRGGGGETVLAGLAGIKGLLMTTLSSSWKLDSISKSLKFCTLRFIMSRRLQKKIIIIITKVSRSGPNTVLFCFFFLLSTKLNCKNIKHSTWKQNVSKHRFF